MFSAWRAMLKDLHELHATYYKRLLYYKGIPCTLDERGSNQSDALSFFGAWRICKEMPANAFIWPITKLLFFNYFCVFLGRSQRWPLNFKPCFILKGPKFKLSFSWRPRLQQLTLPGESRLHHAYVIKVMAGKPSQSAQTASARHRRLSQTIDSLYEQSISTFS